jgi:hypothetical protein
MDYLAHVAFQVHLFFELWLNYINFCTSRRTGKTHPDFPRFGGKLPRTMNLLMTINPVSLASATRASCRSAGKPGVSGPERVTMMRLTVRKTPGSYLELDPKYVDVIVRRWQSFTGRRPRSMGMAGRSMRPRRNVSGCPHESLKANGRLPQRQLRGRDGGLCLALADWLAELRVLLAKRRRSDYSMRGVERRSRKIESSFHDRRADLWIREYGVVQDGACACTVEWVQDE